MYNYAYEVKQTIIVQADSKEEADEKFRQHQYSAVFNETNYNRFTGIRDDHFQRMERELNKNGKWVYYHPVCPYGYTTCIFDPARKKARHYTDGEILPDGTPPCEYYKEGTNDCDDYDDEDK